MSTETKAPRWQVSREGYSTGGAYAQAGCHHRRSRPGSNPSACGGCCARAVDALELIDATGDASTAGEVLEAMRAEGKGKNK